MGTADPYADEAKDFETPGAPGDDRGAFEVDVDRAREAAGLSGDFGPSIFDEADTSAPYVDEAKGDISLEPHRVGLDRIAHQVGLALQDERTHEAATALSKGLDLPFLLGWTAHDALTGTPGRLSAWREGAGISAWRRTVEVDPTRIFDPALFWEGLQASHGHGEFPTPEEYLARPPGTRIGLTSFYPGAPWIEAGHDRRLTADDIPNLAWGAVEFAPWGKILSGARTVYKTVAPSKLGGAFLSATTPDTHVPRLFGPQTSQDLVDAANRAAYELATTGRAEVTVAGRTHVIDQARLDEAYRRANPGKTLTTTAATDVGAFEAGGVIPEFTFPSGAPKPPIEQFQYRTGGASGVVRLAHRSAYGHVPPPAGAPGLAIYSDPISELYIPGMRPTPLEEAIQAGRVRPGDRTYYGGGREVELGKLTGQETQTLRPVAGIGETRAVTSEGTMAPVRVFQAEDLVSPTYTERVRANVLGKLDELRGRHTPGPSVRQATAEEIASSRYGRALDELTDTEAHYVDLAQKGDEVLEAAAARGDDTAQQILAARTEFAETLQRGAQEAAERRVFAGRTYGRDTAGLYVPRGDTPAALDPFGSEAISDRRDRPPPPTTRATTPPPTTRTTLRTPPPPTVRTPRRGIPPTTRRPPPGTPATARRTASSPPARRRPTPTPTPYRPPGLHPRTVEWSQGWARHRLDLLTGEHSVRRAPARELRVTEYTPRPLRPRRINLGLVDTVIAPDGARQFLDQDARVLPSGEIVRRRADRQRPPRQRGVL